MSKQHAVVGVGTAPAKVIAEGLNDVLDEGDSVLLLWTGKPTEGQEAVYDYILDNEIPFVMFYEDGDNPPKVFRENDEGVVQKSRDALAKALSETDGSILVLDEDDDDFLIQVHDMKDPGTVMLSLTNGLAPIVIEDEDPEVAEAASRYEDDEDEEDEDEDDTRFTKDELEVMAASAVKRYGDRIGAKATTKKGIIAELFPDDDEEEHNNGHKSRDGDRDEPDAEDDEPTTPLGQTLPEEDELQQAMDRVVGAFGHFLNVLAGRTN